MPTTNLKRNAAVILNDWVEKGDRVLTKKGCKIQIPQRFVERGLAEITAETKTVGHYAIIIDNVYAVMNTNAMQVLDPTSTTIIPIGDDRYYEFTFAPGSVVIKNTNLVMQDTLIYEIFNEMVSKGRVPWYMSYEDLGKLFTTARYHAGSSIMAGNAIFEMIVASISRNKRDRMLYWRHEGKSIEESLLNPPAVIPLRSPIYSATNTTSKLMGSYFDDSVVSALVNPTEKVEGVEALLRT